MNRCIDCKYCCGTIFGSFLCINEEAKKYFTTYGKYILPVKKDDRCPEFMEKESKNGN